MTIKYRPGQEMLLAEIKLDLRVDYIAFNKAWIETLKNETIRDPALGVVHQLTYHGWPKERRKVPRIARHYWDFRDELTTDDGLLLKGPRIVIPAELRETYLRRLHEGHLSAKKVQENAKYHVYWPGWEADIADYTMRCQECIKQSRPAKESLQPHDIPDGPWTKLGINYFNFKGKSYILICDYFSKFPFMYTSKTSWDSLQDRLIDLFASKGFPDKIVTDNGPPFNSQEFNSCLSKHGIKHTTSSPHYPQSNDFIERQTQTMKNMMFKNESETRSFQEVLSLETVYHHQQRYCMGGV